MVLLSAISVAVELLKQNAYYLAKTIVFFKPLVSRLFVWKYFENDNYVMKKNNNNKQTNHNSYFY